jgi:hypothetical protein
MDGCSAPKGQRSFRRHRWLVGLVGILALIGASVGLVLAISRGSDSINLKQRQASRSPGGGPPALARQVFDVTHFAGCASGGTSNCAPGIQDAIDAAQRVRDGIVRFPPGHYLDESPKPLIIAPGHGIRFQGAGSASSEIVKQAPRRHPTILRVEAPGTVISGIAFDSSGVSGGGAVVLVTCGHVSILQDRIMGGTSTAWPLRFAGGRGTATPVHPTYATGNVVNGLVLSDDPPPDDDGLDFSFQENGSISNVTEYGSRLGLYVDRRVEVSNYHFTPNPAGKANAETGWYITTPSSDITISNFITSGSGGVIGRVPTLHPRAPNQHITIEHEVMQDPNASFSIGDVRDLVIDRSTFGNVHVDPRIVAQGTITDSTWRSLTEHQSLTSVIDLATSGSHQVPSPTATSTPLSATSEAMSSLAEW